MTWDLAVVLFDGIILGAIIGQWLGYRIARDTAFWSGFGRAEIAAMKAVIDRKNVFVALDAARAEIDR